MATSPSNIERPSWPKRAVVTAGMPYGNKPLHFGHIAGVFVPADAFARFLRDRIGAANVRFISGTDCFGSPINEGYRKLVEAGEFDGTIEEYVRKNHEAQKATLDSYNVSLSIYEGSGLGYAKCVHQLISEKFIEKLHENGHLRKRATLQFYDAEAGTFLNGRQVVGRCPVQGCKSEHGYADECDLGHSYAPEDLIAPKSSLTGTTPEMRPVENWYFDLPAFGGFLRDHVARLEADPEVRAIVPKTIKEFLVPPVVYIKNDERAAYEQIASDLPAHELREPEKGKQSFEIEFADIEARDTAREVLTRAGIRFRTGKTLVPFRITGNIEWGVKAPVIEGLEGLTVWCWPESLWAPMSFTMAVNDQMGLPRGSWRDWWCSEDSEVYQFIGQDNLYFYGVAQPALIEALRPGDILAPGETDHPIRQTNLVANYHILFGDKKASSSGAVKPPTADALLEHYTVEQLRAHFLALGLDQKSVGFKPKPYLATEEELADSRVADPVLKEGALLTNVFNRLARSCFYEAQKNFEGYLPLGAVSPAVLDKVNEVLRVYDATMHRVELHTIMSIMDEFIRWANKYWSDGIRAVEKGGDDAMRRQVLVDSFFLLRVATLLMHPVVPAGAEKICDYLSFEFDDFFSWNYDFESFDELCSAGEITEGRHRIRELPPRFDFFEKHPSQYK
ncbi:class I tRNA ligase family protein [Paraeggerthella hongkongensis]|uniref:methionine--tRNA ligase n=1 Tax=Paraeggerthella TaxID=651554 RepID=UPI001C1048BA|nr:MULTISPECIES: class I tRNA ligase family protein [Paraeggerthella]MBU5406317.1 class I tRNA ligase family protein [Paraeggerthella hongkongensis]MCD2432999.1 class I tRNA ligase family protein [Paraeggerthella hominis]